MRHNGLRLRHQRRLRGAGGRKSRLGSIVGAAIVVMLPSLLSDIDLFRRIAVAAAVLAMARAVILSPEVVLLDEPLMGLAPILIDEVFRIIERLKADGLIILLVEQFALAALNVADYGYVPENGRIAVHGPAASLRSDPKVVAAYLGGGRRTEAGPPASHPVARDNTGGAGFRRPAFMS
jgi:hypothetical protein